MIIATHNASDLFGRRWALEQLRRNGTALDGAYCLFRNHGLAKSMRSLVDILDEAAGLIYIGSSCRMRERTGSLRRTLLKGESGPYEHRFSRSYDPSDLYVLLAPFPPGECLERYLHLAHLRKYGSLPLENRRVAHRTSRHDRLTWPTITPGVLDVEEAHHAV